MRLAAIYPTTRRAEILSSALCFMSGQTRRPDVIVISATNPDDIASVPDGLDVRVVYGPQGSSHQRNTGVKAVQDEVDAVVFFDDDYAPAPGYLAAVEEIFESDPGVAGVNGRTIADGACGPGYTFDDARQILASFQPPRLPAAQLKPIASLYGCNMAVRLGMAHGLAFEETLPLYAWQEDVDYSTQLARRGRLVWSDALGGVHLGVKRARTPGRRMGYSQIANPLYLRGKRTMRIAHAYSLMGRNFAANLVRSFAPEPWCDRRGRLAGNLMALRDWAAGRLHPGNILNLD